MTLPPLSSPPPRHQTHAAFTLVELLTVIAIIGILAGILVPVLNHARASARSLTCISNLRSAHQRLVLYAADHKGRFPAPSGKNLDHPDNPDDESWWAVIQKYFQTRYTTPKPGQTDFALNPWYCPAAADTYPIGVNRTFPLNTDGTGSTEYFIPEQNAKWSQTLIVADGTARSGSSDANVSFTTTSGSKHYLAALDPRHNGRINGLFLDGHIRAFPLADPNLEIWVKNLRN
ncbi:prepilin-type N-terminal cleavage/methylation domain-containing protein [Opitutaceae bacterium TAV4]|nr:prepilin-type N-terminal cleavage/methylation domain-containing protein [Opitutaceae bacterium TAV4]RRK01702.1 prepilin-type N-terminal cleavage/methylation domain-containing protein [Opitutaceae bacterium TAV3]